MKMGKCLLLVAILTVLLATPCWGDSGTWYITAGNQDGYIDATTLNNSGPATMFGYLWSSFHHFQSVTIPQGATITSCYIKVHNKTSYTYKPVDLHIYLHDADTGTNPSTRAEYVGLATTTGTAWQINDNWTANLWYDSGDFSADMEEVVGRGGWSSGNNITVLIKNDDADLTWRQPHTYDSATTNDAELHVEWTAGGGAQGGGISGGTGMGSRFFYEEILEW